jgi:hypothetical protein
MQDRHNHDEDQNNQNKAGIGDLFSSMVGLGEATTRFTIGQMQNAMGMLTHPNEAIDRVKDSIDHFSRAMSDSVGGSSRGGGHGKGSTSRSMGETTDEAMDETTGEPSRASDALSGRKQ